MNDGDGISSAVHAATQIYTSTRFGQLLTSSNYDDTQERITGGMNGIGSKACNIFPREFRIETVDHELKLYKQTWTENMSAL
jgi:DNA topoisomerase-2